jgi:predicted negative regulator of RcsB-dependent stress response
MYMKNTTQTILQPQQHGIIDKAIFFFNANKKAVIITVAAVLVTSAGYAAYTHSVNQAYQSQWAKLFNAELNFVSAQEKSLSPLEDFVASNSKTQAAVYARFTLGNAYYQTQEYAKAKDYFNQVAAGENKELAALAEVSVIACEVAQKDYPAAIAAADAFAAKNPTHFALAQVLQYKALAQDLSGDAKGAKESYTKISMQYPNTYYSAFADLRTKDIK